MATQRNLKITTFHDLENLKIQIQNIPCSGELYQFQAFQKQQDKIQKKKMSELEGLLKNSKKFLSLTLLIEGQITQDLASQLVNCLAQLSQIKKLEVNFRDEQGSINVLSFINQALKSKENLSYLKILYDSRQRFDSIDMSKEINEFVQIIENSYCLKELDLQINDESIGYQDYQSIVEAVKRHFQIENLHIKFKDEINLLFLNLYQNNNIQLNINNHSLKNNRLTIKPSHITKPYLPNLTNLLKNQFFSQSIQSLQIIFPRLQTQQNLDSSLGKLSESIANLSQLTELCLTINQNLCSKLTWVVKIFNNLASINHFQKLKLNIESDNTFNPIEQHIFLEKLQNLQEMEEFSLSISNQTENMKNYFNLLKDLPKIKYLSVKNKEICIQTNTEGIQIQVFQKDLTNFQQIKQFCLEFGNLYQITVVAENQNVLSMIDLSVLTSKQIRFKDLKYDLRISSESFLCFDLQISLTDKISENGIKTLCEGLKYNIPQIKDINIVIDRKLTQNEISFLCDMFIVQNQINSLSLKLKNEDFSSQEQMQIILAISENQILKYFNLESGNAFFYTFLSLLTNCNNLEMIQLNKSKAQVERQIQKMNQEIQELKAIDIELYQDLNQTEATHFTKQIENMKHLEQIRIKSRSFDQIENILMDSFSQLFHLKHLELITQEKQNDDFVFFSLLSMHPSLKPNQLKIKTEFNVNFSREKNSLVIKIPNSTFKGNQKVYLEKLLVNFKSLQFLKINIYCKIQAGKFIESLSNSLSYLETLKNLEIKTKNTIDSSDVSKLFTKMKSLKCLEYFKFKYQNNQIMNCQSIDDMNQILNQLNQIKQFDLQITGNAQIFYFNLKGLKTTSNFNQLIENENNKFQCETGTIKRRKKILYNFDRKEFTTNNIFKGIKIEKLNMFIHQNSQKYQIFQSIFSENSFQNLAHLHNLSIKVQKDSLDDHQIQQLTSSISLLKNVTNLNLSFKRLKSLNEKQFILLGQSIKKQEKLQSLQLMIKNDMEYPIIEEFIQNIQDSRMIEKLSLNFNLKDSDNQIPKKYFDNNNLINTLHSFNISIAGQAKDMCQLIYQIIHGCQSLNSLYISIGENSGILQENINHLNKGLLTLQGLKTLSIKIQKQQQSNDLLLCNLFSQSQLQNLILDLDNSNVSEKTINKIIDDLKQLGNVHQFKCFIDHPYAFKFLELLEKIEVIQFNNLCKYKAEKIEKIDEPQKKVRIGSLEDLIIKCPSNSLKNTIERILCSFNQDDANKNKLKSLQIQIRSQKDLFKDQKNYSLNGLAFGLINFNLLQSIDISFPETYQINEINGQYLKNMLEKLTYLFEIKLSFTKIDQDGCKAIGPAFKFLQYLISIDIYIGDENRIRDEGIINLISEENFSSQIQSLSLNVGRSNDINQKGEGIKKICKTLKKNKDNLTQLVLKIKENNNIGQGAKDLKEILIQMKRLQKLTVNIDDIDLYKTQNQHNILGSIKELEQLQVLSINILGLNKQNRSEFIYYIKLFRMLVNFEFQNKTFEKDQKESALLQTAVKNNTSLQSIKYRFDPILFHNLPVKLIEIDTRLKK